jgi:hypothetical protein
MALIYMTMDAVKCHELYNVGGILCERNFWAVMPSMVMGALTSLIGFPILVCIDLLAIPLLITYLRAQNSTSFHVKLSPAGIRLVQDLSFITLSQVSRLFI